MKQFFAILRFEYLNYAKNKVFVVLTALLIVAVGVLLSWPRISQLWETPESQEPGTSQRVDGEPSGSGDVGELEKLGFQDLSGGDQARSFAFYQAALEPMGYELQQVEGEDGRLREMVDGGEYRGILTLTGPLSYRYLVKNLSMYDMFSQVLDQLVVSRYQNESLSALGISPEESVSILQAAAEGEIVQTGKDQMENFFYTYVLIFALYMAIVLYGQLVATSVASEKSSRAMEMLITSAKPVNLMFGKVLGSGLAGLTQMVLIFGSGYLFFNVNRRFWEGNQIICSIFDMPAAMLGYCLLFFVLGFFIYAFMYGALGSLANRSEDINTLVLPVTFLFIIAFMVTMFSMSSGNVDSPLMVVCSFIPFTSPMAMFTRIAMGEVSGVSILLSVVILLVSTVGLGYLSAIIYRMGVLLYGKPPKLNELFRMLRNQRKAERS